MTTEQKITVQFTEQELRIIKSALTEEIKKSDKNSKKWNAGILGPNPFIIVSDKLRDMVKYITETSYRAVK